MKKVAKRLVETIDRRTVAVFILLIITVMLSIIFGSQTIKFMLSCKNPTFMLVITAIMIGLAVFSFFRFQDNVGIDIENKKIRNEIMRKVKERQQKEKDRNKMYQEIISILKKNPSFEEEHWEIEYKLSFLDQEKLKDEWLKQTEKKDLIDKIILLFEKSPLFEQKRENIEVKLFSLTKSELEELSFIMLQKEEEWKTEIKQYLTESEWNIVSEMKFGELASLLTGTIVPDAEQAF